MKIKIIIILLSVSSFVSAQFFSPEKLVETGVYYYPEAWSPNQWERDIQKMSEMGFEFIHLAEFSWAKLEPSEGNYNFEWLDKTVELAAKYKLKVILGTPTAAPPAWLVEKYPDVLIEMANGLSTMHGTREHYSWSSPTFRALTKKIVEAMATRYGQDKRIWGWQIDNEPSHYGNLDFGPSVQINFRLWLKNKYKTIDALNTAWGTDFWSVVYSNFEQIQLPNLTRLNSRPACPTALLDMKRFNADECADYVSLQNKILKGIVSKTQFVTTNFMNLHSDVDPWRNKDLDFISYTMYPVGGYSNGLGDQGFRLGDYWRISYVTDFSRALNGVTGVMELQPGQINGVTNYRPQPYPGAIRSWMWNCFGSGVDFICTYRFRQPLSGFEQFHQGIVGTDGVTLSTGGKQFSQFMSEIRELRKQYKPNTSMPKEYEMRKTALLYHPDNLWETTIQPQTAQWDEMGHIIKYYSNLKSLCAPVDIVDESKDLSAYPVVVIPAYQLVDKALVEKWSNYAENGGQLVISCRTALQDRNGRFFELPWAGAIAQLIGADIPMFDALSTNNQSAKINFEGNSFGWNNWGDILDPKTGTETWATYADQFYANKAAVVHCKKGKGTVTYIGVDTDDGKLEKAVLKKVYATAGIGVQELPEGVIVNWRKGFWVANNYSSVNVTLNLPANATVILGNKEIVPAGVLVWK